MDNFNANYKDDSIVVEYTPSIGTVRYNYVVKKDGKVNLHSDGIDNNKTVFVFENTGEYTIEINEYDSQGSLTTIESEEYNINSIDYDNSSLLMYARGALLLVLIFIILLFVKIYKATKLEKRFSKFTVNSNRNIYLSIKDNIKNFYKKCTIQLGDKISNSVFLTNISKRYKKYADAFNIKDGNPIYIISKKIIIGILYLLVLIILKLRYTLMQPYEMVLPFIAGYYSLDVIYIYKYSKYRKRIENDILSAITVMNNAFKAGRSVKQAIDTVANQLEGPIANEFKIISLEFEYGIDIEESFKRFSDRINIEEAVYLTSSLSVLNKTGGNIIEVFSMIENTLYNRKKLSLELKSLTSSSKLIMYVLMIVPFIFIMVINFINKDYFKPLYTNPLGLVLIGIILIIYIAYIIVVRRVMKVRM